MLRGIVTTSFHIFSFHDKKLMKYSETSELCCCHRHQPTSNTHFPTNTHIQQTHIHVRFLFLTLHIFAIGCFSWCLFKKRLQFWLLAVSLCFARILRSLSILVGVFFFFFESPAHTNLAQNESGKLLILLHFC